MIEVFWKPVKDFPRYEVNIWGNVRRVGSTDILKVVNKKGRFVWLKNEEGRYVRRGLFGIVQGAWNTNEEVTSEQLQSDQGK